MHRAKPTIWYALMHVMAKKSRKPSRAIDRHHQACLGQSHTTPFLQCMAMHRNSTKTILDAWNGYHLGPLQEEDRHLTTFLMPWGRYKYCNLSNGDMAAGEAYTAR